MKVMHPRNARVYYINNTDNQVYRLDNYGFDINTHEKRVILKNLESGERWDMPVSTLSKECLIDGRPTPIWEQLPEGWYPKKEERDYPGYTNDPRKELDEDGYDAYGRQHRVRRSAVDNFNRKYSGFKR